MSQAVEAFDDNFAQRESALEEYIEINADFDYSDDKRVTEKDAVEHGPDWDASKA